MAAPHPDWTGRVLRSDRRPQVVIGPSIAVGGEGAVHRIEGSEQHVAKLYHDLPTVDRAAKLAVMTGMQNERVRNVTAMPESLLRDGERVVGFVMRMAGDRAEVHHWFSPKDRRNRYPHATYDLIVAISRNLAACVDEIHDAGMVIGDVNERGFLIGIGKHNLGTVTAIDCDSFQVQAADGRLLPCEVGILEYLPPELHGQRIDHVRRMPEHDRFGLAILIYKLLMMGRHPYMGVYPVDLEDGLAVAIGKGWYVHGRRAPIQGVRPPPASLGTNVAGPAVAGLWERSFTGPPADRPTALEWIGALDGLARDLVGCQNNARHRHRRQGACPWCAFVAAHRIDYFPAPGSTQDVVFDLPVDQADALVVSIRGWLLRLSPVLVARPGPVERPLGRFPHEREALEACIGPLRAAAAQTRAYTAAMAAQYRALSDWRDACARTEGENERRRQAWREAEHRRRQAWIDATAAVDQTVEEDRRRYRIALTEHEEWLLSNRDAIILTVVIMVMIVGLILGLNWVGVAETTPALTVGLVVAGFIGLLVRHVAARRKAKAGPPVEPARRTRPPEPDPEPEPEADPLPVKPTFPVLPTPFHKDLVAIRCAGVQQGERIIGDIRRRALAAAAEAKRQVDTWESWTNSDLDNHVNEIRSASNQLDGAAAAYRRLRAQYAEQMQVIRIAWETDAKTAYLDSVQVSESRRWTGLDPSLIDALESFGVESALDVLHELVPGRVKVPGIGPVRTGKLENWVRQQVIPRFDRTKYPLSGSPRAQKLQHETLTAKAGLESAISTAMERIQVARATHDRLHAERSSQALDLAAPFRDSAHDLEATTALMAWWEGVLGEIVG